MPKSKKTEFDKLGFDHAKWTKYFQRYQQEYLRKRLRAIKLFAENTCSIWRGQTRNCQIQFF